MKFKLLLFMILVGAGFQLYGKYFDGIRQEATAFLPMQKETQGKPSSKYRCDGRTRCSQMTSCEEAKFFLDNCPGTMMDGDNDGNPCEQQWCN